MAIFKCLSIFLEQIYGLETGWVCFFHSLILLHLSPNYNLQDNRLQNIIEKHLIFS